MPDHLGLVQYLHHGVCLLPRLSLRLLVIVDNVQASFQPGGSSPLVSLYNSVARNQAPRLVTITPHLLASNTDPGLSFPPRQLSSLIPASVETACYVNNLARPSKVIIATLPDLNT